MSNGNSDVKLLPGQVKIEAWDLCLDSKDRRHNDSAFRRALVHDPEDGLTINWGNDYPGGVTIKKLRHIDARGNTLSSPNAIHLTIDGNTRCGGNIEIQGKAQFDKDVEFVPGKVVIKGFTQAIPVPGAAHPPGSIMVLPPIPIEINVSEYIMKLRNEVDDLKKRVAVLEAKG